MDDGDGLDDVPLAQRAAMQIKRDEESSMKRKREEEDLKLAKKVSLGLRHGSDGPSGAAKAASGAGASGAAAKQKQKKAAANGDKGVNLPPKMAMKVGTVKAGVAKPKAKKPAHGKDAKGKRATKHKTLGAASSARTAKKKTATGDDVKWRTLEHHGVVFPDAYVPHGVKPLYDGKPLDLLPEEEEAATHYAVMLETDYVSKPKFIQNFWKDFRALLRKELRDRLTDFKKMDFRPIFEWHKRRSEEKKNIPKEEKKRAKEIKDELEKKYTTAVIDGKVRRSRVTARSLRAVCVLDAALISLSLSLSLSPLSFGTPESLRSVV